MCQEPGWNTCARRMTSFWGAAGASSIPTAFSYSKRGIRRPYGQNIDLGVSASGWKYNTIIDEFGPLFSGGLSRTAGAWQRYFGPTAVPSGVVIPLRSGGGHRRWVLARPVRQPWPPGKPRETSVPWRCLGVRSVIYGIGFARGGEIYELGAYPGPHHGDGGSGVTATQRI